MAGKVDEADVFGLSNFWRTSTFLKHIEPDATPTATSHVSFFSKDITNDPAFGDANPLALPPIEASQHGFFQIPLRDVAPQASTIGGDGSPPTAADSLEPSTSCNESEANGSDDSSDMWTSPKIPVEQAPVYRTWDAFIAGKPVTTLKPMFLSEAGPTAYDALLCDGKDPLTIENAGVPVVNLKTYLSSLLALALGRESILFSRREKTGDLKPVLPMMRVSGYSADVLLGLERQCARCARALADLQSFVDFAYQNHPSRCSVALASTVSQIIQVVQEWVVTKGRNPRSILQLQSSINAVLAILGPFQTLTSQLHQDLSDEDILTLVFHQSYAVDNNEEYLRQIMREVLRRVSGPWIEFLEEWIGTRREEGLPLTKDRVGASKGFVTVRPRVFLDDFGRETEEVDFAMDQERMPRFMPRDVATTIFETGRNLRFIRTFHPHHSLARSSTVVSSKPPKAEWLYDWDAILELEGRVARYRDNLLEAIQTSRARSFSSVPTYRDRSQQTNPIFEFKLFGLDQDTLERRLASDIEHFSQPIERPEHHDLLTKVIQERLSGTRTPSIELSNSTPHWSLLPVLSFGSIASAQAQVVNREALKLLFTAHDLRGHLRLQRDFQLLGNGTFCSRLSQALFNPELETTEKRQGYTRSGGVMGLRLGGRDTWPPASSELRLALMGILAESYEAQTGSKLKASGSGLGESSELPGDLSFAVRDLSDEEIDKCMNPDSLEALDFLRLSYTTPPQLGCIITPMSLMQYDRIFRLLLRVLRVLFVVDRLFRDVVMSQRWEDDTGGGGGGKVEYRFVREAQHFVSSLAAYLLDTGVAVPWKLFEDKLDKIQAGLLQGGGRASSSHEEEEELQSPDRLRELHSLVLDRILVALFLRKRQQNVLHLVEEILNSVLQFAKYVRLRSLGRNMDVDVGVDMDVDGGNVRGPAACYREFRKKVGKFVRVCRGLSDKARRSRDNPLLEADRSLREQFGTGDDSMIAQLLVKLDMFEYYAKNPGTG